MQAMELREKFKEGSIIKKVGLWMLLPRNQARPRYWVRLFVNPFVHHRGKHSRICRSARMDVLPSRQFSLGKDSTIEDFVTINNGVGDVIIGDRTRIGIGSVVIGPAKIGNDVRLAQNIVISGLNHIYFDPSQPIHSQGVRTEPIEILAESWIGANAVIMAGIKIGKHSVVAAGSVVIRDVPDFTVVAGNPARPIRRYNPNKKMWEKLKPIIPPKTSSTPLHSFQNGGKAPYRGREELQFAHEYAE